MVTSVATDPIAEAVALAQHAGELRVPVQRPITDEFLHELNAKYEIVAFQAASETELIISAPPSGPSPMIHLRVLFQLRDWLLARIGGEALSSDFGYHPPRGRAWIPDASWLSAETLSEFERLGRPGYATGFWQITPDFILEVRSRTQTVASQQQKMTEWAAAGVKLGLLIDPESKTAWLYRPDGSINEHAQPATLSMEPEMPGLELDFSEIWAFPWV